MAGENRETRKVSVGAGETTRGPRPLAGMRGLVVQAGRALAPLLALVAVVLFFGIYDLVENGNRATFFTAGNARTIAAQTATVAVASLGMLLIIIAGGIDLSAGCNMALCSVVMARLLRDDYGVALALVATLGVGCLGGLINGVLISSLRVVPFIVTLGTMTIYLGLAQRLADETTVRPTLSQVPHWMDRLVTRVPDPLWLIPDRVPNFADGVWLALILAAILAAVLRYTVFGRYVFALGSNEATARLCGVRVPLVKIAVYTLGGLFFAIAGIYHFARLSTGDGTSGIGLELRVIAAVVIGGGSLNGGRGSVLGTMAGAAIMAVINSGCTLIGWKNPEQQMILGAVIVAAVTLDQWRQRRAES